MMIEEWQAKKLYINKEQLENALGISLSELPTKLFEYNEPLADYLIPYASMRWFDIEDCVALLVGENPERFKILKTRSKYDFYGVKTAIKQAIESGELCNSEIIQDYYDEFNCNEFYHYKIDHYSIEKWAKQHGYKWELPPYQPLISKNCGLDNSTILQQLTAKDEEIAQLKAEIENLKKPELTKDKTELEQAKDNEFTPCYLNKFTSIDPLAIAIQVRNSEWKNYDPEIDFKRSATQIKNTIKKKYKDLGVSDTLAEMIEKIACPIDRTRNK